MAKKDTCLEEDGVFGLMLAIMNRWSLYVCLLLFTTNQSLTYCGSILIGYGFKLYPLYCAHFNYSAYLLGS